MNSDQQHQPSLTNDWMYMMDKPQVTGFSQLDYSSDGLDEAEMGDMMGELYPEYINRPADVDNTVEFGREKNYEHVIRETDSGSGSENWNLSDSSSTYGHISSISGQSNTDNSNTPNRKSQKVNKSGKAAPVYVNSSDSSQKNSISGSDPSYFDKNKSRAVVTVPSIPPPLMRPPDAGNMMNATSIGTFYAPDGKFYLNKDVLDELNTKNGYSDGNTKTLVSTNIEGNKDPRTGFIRDGFLHQQQETSNNQMGDNTRQLDNVSVLENEDDGVDFGDGGEEDGGDPGGVLAFDARAKNRAHAKNTRMRKKSYIESLKILVANISDDAEKTFIDRRNLAQTLADQNIQRKNAILAILDMRAYGELDADMWHSLLDANIEMVLPITPYRSFPPIEIIDCQRHVSGIQSFVVDVASLNIMIQSLGCQSENRPLIRAKYDCNPDEIVVGNDGVMAKFTFRTDNAVELGARCDLFVEGMLRAVFSEADKVCYFEMFFDIMNVMQQLRQANTVIPNSLGTKPRQEFQVVPNTYRIAKEICSEPRLVCESNHPYAIVFVNQNFCDIFGFSEELLINQSIFNILSTSAAHSECIQRLQKMLRSVQNRIPSSTILQLRPGESFGHASQVNSWSSNSSKKIVTHNSCFCKIFPLYYEGSFKQALSVMDFIPETQIRSRLMPAPTAVQAFAQHQYNALHQTQANHTVSWQQQQGHHSAAASVHESGATTHASESHATGSSFDGYTASGINEAVPRYIRPPKSISSNLKFVSKMTGPTVPAGRDLAVDSKRGHNKNSTK